MGYNKVIVNGVTKVDLTSDTVSPDTMLESTTAHNAAGDLVTGTIPVNPQLSVADGGAVIVSQGYYSGSELIGYLLPIPTAEDAKKVVRVNDLGTGYELVDPSELNGPVGVTETATGNPAVLLNSIGGQKLRGLKIYGKTTQAGTPDGSYLPLASPGTGGSILVTVSDGNTQSQQLTAGMPAGGLPGIPVASGGTVIIGGQRYAANILDYGAGLDTIAVGRIVLDGTETWIMQSGQFGAPIPEAKLPYNNLLETNGLCSHFDYASTNNGMNGVYVYIVDGTVGAIVSGSVVKHFGSNVETWKTFLQAQSSQGHPVEVLYRLAEPYTQAIPAEELVAYLALTTYDGMTVVSTAEPVAGLEVKYLTELQSYTESVVDKKVSEAVTSAVILAQGGAV